MGTLYKVSGIYDNPENCGCFGCLRPLESIDIQRILMVVETEYSCGEALGYIGVDKNA